RLLNKLCPFSFFFTSRRRHTRCSRDWSSDVCSSDLLVLCPTRDLADQVARELRWPAGAVRGRPDRPARGWGRAPGPGSRSSVDRSEERRAGKKWGCKEGRDGYAQLD